MQRRVYPAHSMDPATGEIRTTYEADAGGALIFVAYTCVVILVTAIITALVMWEVLT